jgi:hypothetical protein
MTPEEKASELYDKFYALYPNQDAQWIAQEAATIAVNEILEDREEIDGMRIINDPYWLEVKQEIEKL